MSRSHTPEGDEAPAFVSRRRRGAFDKHVDAKLREYGFEPGLSPIAEKWARIGLRTVLLARVHQWSPDLVEFYLEDKRGRLIEATRSDARTFDAVLHRYALMQDKREGA